MKRTIVTIEEILYYAFFCILLFAKGMGLYDGQPAFKCCLVLALICWIGKMAATRYSVKEILLIGLLLALGAVTYIRSGEKGILLFVMMLAGMKNIAIERIMRLGLWAWGSSFFLLTFTSLMHMQDMGYKVHDKLGLGYIFRYGLGYAHPNVLHVSYFILVIFIVYTLSERYDWKHFIGLMLGNILIFSYSVSYTGVAIVMAYLAVALYVAKRKRMNTGERFLCNLVYPFCCLLSLWGSVLLKNHEELFRIINKIVNERLRLSQIFLVEENISLFGVRVADIITESLTMDNAYVYLLITHGIVTFAVVSIGYLYLVYAYSRENKAKELVIIVFICFMGIMEPYLFNTSFKNVIFLFIGELLYRKCEASLGGAERTIGIAPWTAFCQRSIPISENILRWLQTAKCRMAQRRKVILTAGMIGGILAAAAAGVIFSLNEPPGYIIIRNQTGIIDEEYFYINDNWEEKYPSYQVVGTMDEDEPVNAFDGMIVQVEKARACENGFVIGSVLTAAAMCVFFIIKRQKEQEVYENTDCK